MTAHPPPIPPDQQSNKGGGDKSRADVTGAPGSSPENNADEQGRSGNIHQNTTHGNLSKGPVIPGR